jgi:hypothetical protein
VTSVVAGEFAMSNRPHRGRLQFFNRLLPVAGKSAYFPQGDKLFPRGQVISGDAGLPETGRRGRSREGTACSFLRGPYFYGRMEAARTESAGHGNSSRLLVPLGGERSSGFAWQREASSVAGQFCPGRLRLLGNALVHDGFKKEMKGPQGLKVSGRVGKGIFSTLNRRHPTSSFPRTGSFDILRTRPESPLARRPVRA